MGMDMKNDNLFNFDNEANGGFTSPSNGFEDIVSDSHYKNKGGKHRYRKHRRGVSGFFYRVGYKFSDWWHSLRKGQRRTIIALVSTVLVIGVVLGTLRVVFDYNYNDITDNPEDLGFENVINSKIVNVALFGIDSREEGSFKGRSDSIMILSINTETKKVKVISVMRDSLVPVTYKGKTTYAKINSAYSKGGPELAIKTLNTIFGLDISEYATVNFYGMSDIIEAVGGIDVNLVKGEINVDGYENGHKVNFGINGMIQEQCSYMGIDPTPYYISESQAGEIHLNGIQAVAYARIRHAANAEGTNNDQGRTDRQRYVMEQLFNKAVTLNKSKYVSLAKALIPCSETSLSYSEIMGLAVNVLLQSPKFEQTRVPLDDYQMRSQSVSGQGSCVYYDLDYAGKLIRAFIYDDIMPEDYIEQNGVEKNDWYAKRSSGTSSGVTSSGTASASSSSASTPSSSTPSDTSSDNSTDVSSDEINSSQGVSSGSEPESSSSSESGSSETDSNPDDSSSTPEESSPEDGTVKEPSEEF